MPIQAGTTTWKVGENSGTQVAESCDTETWWIEGKKLYQSHVVIFVSLPLKYWKQLSMCSCMLLLHSDMMRINTLTSKEQLPTQEMGPTEEHLKAALIHLQS